MPSYSTGSATTGTWTTWCDSTPSITGASAWGYWIDDTNVTASTSSTITTSSTSSTSDIWGYWIERVSESRIIVHPVHELTEEEKQLEAELAESNRLAAIERKKIRDERKAKATKLLLETLDRKQKKDLEKRKHFYVRGGKSGHLYKIKQGRVGNVELVDARKRVKQKLCAHPQIGCPDEDTMLVQKVMIEHMEDHFRDIANITYH